MTVAKHEHGVFLAHEAVVKKLLSQIVISQAEGWVEDLVSKIDVLRQVEKGNFEEEEWPDKTVINNKCLYVKRNSASMMQSANGLIKL